MSAEMNKKNVLDRVNQSRAHFESVLAPYNDDQLVNLISPAGWTLKDVMAHVMYWEAYALDRFREVSAGQKPRLFGDLTPAQVDEINHGWLEDGRQQTLDEVKTAFKQVHQDLLAAVEAVPEDTDHSWWSLWPDHNFPWRLVEWNTWGHYAEHLQDMEKWLLT
jgi:hypothetical protein